VEEIQQMEPDLQLLSENASLLLEGTGGLFETEEKRYQDTMDSASDVLKPGVCVCVVCVCVCVCVCVVCMCVYLQY